MHFNGLSYFQMLNHMWHDFICLFYFCECSFIRSIFCCFASTIFDLQTVNKVGSSLLCYFSCLELIDVVLLNVCDRFEFF